METPINRFSSIEIKDDLKNVLYELMQDVLWNKVFYVASFATTTVTATTSTEDLSARESDTTGGLYLSPRQKTRFKTMFYLGTGPTNSVVYIASPAVSVVQTAPTAMVNNDMNFVGIKIDSGNLYLVSRNREKSNETLVATGITITDDTTHLLEIIYNPRESTDFYLDNKYIGSVKSDISSDDVYATFFPYITSIRSNSGSVNLTIEGYEFIQERQ